MYNIPLNGVFKVTAIFGATGSFWSKHGGVDMTCADRRIYATCDGEVSYVGYDGSGGYYISLKPNADASLRLLTFHQAKITTKIKKGDKVTRNTIIGTMGDTGKCTGVHVHYEIRKIGLTVTSIDPTPYMGIPNKVGTYNTKNYPLINYTALYNAEKANNAKISADLTAQRQSVIVLTAKLKVSDVKLAGFKLKL